MLQLAFVKWAATVLQSKRRKFRFEELQLKYFFHVFSMSYVY